jgi:hypothetical protein
VSFSFIGGSGVSGSASTTLTLTNSGNSPATLSGFSVGYAGSIQSSAGSMTGTISANGVGIGYTKTASATYSYYGTDTASGTSAISIIGTHPKIGTVTSSPFSVSVTATKAVPNLIAIPDVTSISAEVGKATSNVTITFNNYGNAPLTISSVTGNGGVFITNITRTGPSITSVAANSSASTTYTFTRSNIGTSLTTISISSNDPAGVKTVQVSVTGVARVPTFQLTSGTLGVTTTSFTDKAGRLSKNSTVKTEIFNMEPNANYMFTLFWTEGQDQYTSGGTGVWSSRSSTTDPKTLSVTSGTSNASGYAAPWNGTGGAQETKYWRAGRNRFYAQIPVGKYDSGLQAWYTNSTSGTSAAGSSSGWAVSTTSPEAACGVNQVWIGFRVIPDVTWSLSDYNPVQGSSPILTVSGCASNSEIYFNTTYFQNTPGSNLPFNGQPVLNKTSIITDFFGEYSGAQIASNAIGTYSTARVISQSGAGSFYDTTYIGPIRSVDIYSPGLFVVSDNLVGPEFGVGASVSLYPTAAGTPAGTYTIYRRFPATNGGYNVRVACLADDSVSVYYNGSFIVSAPNWVQTYSADLLVIITDGYSHWRFDFTNGGATGPGNPGYFAVAVYVGTPPAFADAVLYFATESPVCLAASHW